MLVCAPTQGALPPSAISRRINCKLLGFGIKRFASVHASTVNAELTGMVQHQQQFIWSEAGPILALRYGLF